MEQEAAGIGVPNTPSLVPDSSGAMTAPLGLGLGQ